MKVVEPPPGPPVLATLLAEIYGPDPEPAAPWPPRCARPLRSVPFIVDVDDSFGDPARRLRIAIDQDNLEYFTGRGARRLRHACNRSTAARLSATRTAAADASRSRSASAFRSATMLGERALTTPVPANALPGDRGVVELGDVVRVSRERGVLSDLPPQRPSR